MRELGLPYIKAVKPDPAFALYRRAKKNFLWWNGVFWGENMNAKHSSSCWKLLSELKWRRVSLQGNNFDVFQPTDAAKSRIHVSNQVLLSKKFYFELHIFPPFAARQNVVSLKNFFSFSFHSFHINCPLFACSNTRCISSPWKFSQGLGNFQRHSSSCRYCWPEVGLLGLIVTVELEA